jgi:hypothetical protein
MNEITEIYYTNEEMKLYSFKVSGDEGWKGASLCNPEESWGENEKAVSEWIKAGKAVPPYPEPAPMTTKEKLKSIGIDFDDLKALINAA